MAPIPTSCGEPPPVTNFHVADCGDSYAILQWSVATMRPVYSFELAYNALDDAVESVTLHLPKSQKLVLLKNLRSKTNYTSKILSLNDCAKSQPVELGFETKETVLHPALTHVMPHEIILTLIVFLIWALILRHFFVIYNRLTLVSPQSLGGYLTTRKHSTWKSSKELSQSSSKQTLMSKTETKPNFNILEEAAFQWRSETVLSTRRNSDASAPSILKPIGYSSQSAIVGDGFGQRNSNISLFTGTARSSYSGGPVIFLTSSMTPPESRRPSRSHYLVAPGSASVHSCPTAFSTSQSYSAVSKPLLSPEDQENPVVRKVSEVLLGKATNDIRRCSFKQGEDERPNLGRRKSLLESLSGGIRGSFKRKKRKRSPKYEMEALKEEKEGSWTPNELSKSETVAGIGFGKSQVRQKLSETYLGTSQSSNRLESPDSYLTASDSSSTALPE